MLGFWGSILEVITFCEDRQNLSPSLSTLGMEITSTALTVSLLFCFLLVWSSLHISREKQLSLFHTKIRV